MYYSGVIDRLFDNKEPFPYAIRLFCFPTYTSFENSVSTILLPIVVRDAGCILTLNCIILQDRTENSKCD